MTQTDSQHDGVDHLQSARDRLRAGLDDADLEVGERDAVNSALGHLELTIQSLQSELADEATDCEVVIRPDGGLDAEHAKLIKSRLTRDGFHDEAVHVRPAPTATDGSER